MDFFKEANQKARKDIDNVIKIYVALFKASFRRLFPLFILGILTILGSCHLKTKQLDVSFLCVYPVIVDKFRHNIAKRWDHGIRARCQV